MYKNSSELPSEVLSQFRAGLAIPAHPLALTEDRKLDVERQRALTRYYVDAGAGGLAVGVHTTQFAIREHGLYEPVLKLAATTANDWSDGRTVLVAGVTGKTAQAVEEATIARGLGYHAALLNVAAFRSASEDEVLAHCKRVAQETPIIGFSLLPECGGFHLSHRFWVDFCKIENVIGIKMAPFNRYRTLDIARAVVDASAADRVILYTGNDDHIMLDLIAPLMMKAPHGGYETVRIRGGLLGHWSVWTRNAAQLLQRVHAEAQGDLVPNDLLALDSVVTDCNAAIYDARNDFRGCVPGCLEVLRRQGLVKGTWCLNPQETLSPGQVEDIDRVYRDYPAFNDDAFVKANLDRWLADDGRSIPLVTE
ncbi:dihydrodipicolinate synthase family protein [Cupriavidus sp. 8B]